MLERADTPEAAGLNWARLRSTRPVLRFERKGKGWSARVSRGYRALAKERKEGLVWFWIGPHDEYERLIGD